MLSRASRSSGQLQVRFTELSGGVAMDVFSGGSNGLPLEALPSSESPDRRRDRRGSPIPKRSMTTTDEAVLEFIGREGRSLEALSDRFPGFDIMRLARARLVEISPHPLRGETVAHVHESSGQACVVLTPRGAEAVGIDFERRQGV